MMADSIFFEVKNKLILNIGNIFVVIYNDEGKHWKRHKRIDYNYFRTVIMFNTFINVSGWNL